LETNILDNVPELSDLSKMAFQRLGENVFYLQKIEGMLKTLVEHCDVSGSASELPDLFKRLREPASKKTMGGLVTEFFERLYSEVPDPERPEDAELPWIAFGFRFGGSEESVQEQVELLSSILYERNHLIHHELPFLDLKSDDALKRLAARMDGQLARIESVHKILIRYINFVNVMKSQLPDIMRQVIQNPGVESPRKIVVRVPVQPSDS
jgi:hypothetical protein